MRQYVARRLLFGLIVIWGVSVMIFFLMRFLPGEAVYMVLGEDVSADPKLVAAVKARLGLDKPVHEQYLVWISGVLRGDMGKSLQTDEPVVQQILARLPVTLELGVLSTILGIVIAIPIGVISALRQDTRIDYVLRVSCIILLAMPAFWVGTMLLVFPSIWFKWVPPLGYTEFFQDPKVNLTQLAFPVFVLATHFSTAIMRLTRSSLLEVLRQDYIRTAWSKGLRESVVVARHALKNAMIPVVTVIGLHMGRLVGGTVLLESIFSLPGVGRLFLESVIVRDYTQVQAIVLLFALVFTIANILVDITYGWLDPRIKLSR